MLGQLNVDPSALIVIKSLLHSVLYTYVSYVIASFILKYNTFFSLGINVNNVDIYKSIILYMSGLNSLPKKDTRSISIYLGFNSLIIFASSLGG